LSLFKKLCKEVDQFLKKQIQSSKFNVDDKLDVPSSIKKRTISNGLRYALATGNW
jgi:hypothetical protein